MSRYLYLPLQEVESACRIFDGLSPVLSLSLLRYSANETQPGCDSLIKLAEYNPIDGHSAILLNLSGWQHQQLTELAESPIRG